MVGRPRKNPVENLVGKVVLFNAGRHNGPESDEQILPLLVTHSNSDGTIDGVLFTARPHEIGGNGPAQRFVGIKQGKSSQQWRIIGGE